MGTVTEIYDYLRLMYARIGVPHCPICGREITQQTVDEMVDEVLKLPERTRFQVLAPVVRARKGTQAKELDAARRAGHRVQLAQMELRENSAQNVDILAERGLRRAKHLTECAERENFIRGFHQNPCHGGKSLVTADAVHVHPSQIRMLK